MIMLVIELGYRWAEILISKQLRESQSFWGLALKHIREDWFQLLADICLWILKYAFDSLIFIDLKLSNASIVPEGVVAN